MNLAHRLAILVSERLGLRTRSEKPGLLGRAAPRWPLDWEEARMCGQAAVRTACSDTSGVMITLQRETGPDYRASTGVAPLESVAFIERLFPAEWRSPEGNDVMPAFREYAGPLIGRIDPYERLSPARVASKEAKEKDSLTNER